MPTPAARKASIRFQIAARDVPASRARLSPLAGPSASRARRSRSSIAGRAAAVFGEGGDYAVAVRPTDGGNLCNFLRRPRIHVIVRGLTTLAVPPRTRISAMTSRALLCVLLLTASTTVAAREVRL